MSWPTVEELSQYTQRKVDAGDPGAQLLLDLAKGAVQAEARQTLELVANETITLDGNGYETLTLPQLPVVNVDSVLLNGATLTVDVDYVWYSSGILRRLPKGATWGDKPKSVVVQYDHGYSEIPNAIRGLVLAIAARQHANPEGVQSESIGAYSVTFADAQGNTQSVPLTGDERRILVRYASEPSVA